MKNTKENPSSPVLITVSGPDRPGITSELTAILAASQVRVLDIGQAVIHGLLSLSILFQLPPEDADSKTTIKDLLFKATELGLKLEFQVLPEATRSHPSADRLHRYAVTLLAPELGAKPLHEVAATLVRFGLNIDDIHRLSDGQDLGCVEFIVSAASQADERILRGDLLQVGKKNGIDIAVQADGIFRRAKRLVVLDIDSTLIEGEVIDDLARKKGVFDEVSKLTLTAMQGGLQFDEALRLRVEKIAGLTREQVDSVYSEIRLTPGAEDLVRILKRLGYKIALISGGFSFFADRLKERLGVDYAYANQLEFTDGKLTGRVVPPIVNAQRKADLLDTIVQQERLHLDQVIAIGDGANDLLMLEKAGLGIAFNAKPIVRERAGTAVNQKNLRSILYLLGIPAREQNLSLS